MSERIRILWNELPTKDALSEQLRQRIAELERENAELRKVIDVRSDARPLFLEQYDRANKLEKELHAAQEAALREGIVRGELATRNARRDPSADGTRDRAGTDESR